MQRLIWEKRIKALENQLAFQEDSVDKINQIVIKHEFEISKLREQIIWIIKKIKSNTSLNIALDTEETLPPHY